jgi:hypothetical protein
MWNNIKNRSSFFNLPYGAVYVGGNATQAIEMCTLLVNDRRDSMYRYDP